MSYKPNDIYYQSFVTFNVSGVSSNLDALPNGIINRNGLDDFSASKVFLTNVDTGRYIASGLISSSYSAGDFLSVIVSGYIGGNLSKSVLNLGVLDSKRVGDLFTTGIGVTGVVSANVVQLNGIPTFPYQGLAVSGGNNWITLANAEPADCTVYVRRQIIISSGNCNGQARVIIAASGQTVYVDPPWYSQIPYSNTAYNINTLGSVNLHLNQNINPTGLSSETVGQALYGGWQAAFGQWTLTQISSTGLLLNMYSASGALIKSWEMASDFTNTVNPTRRY